MERGKLVFLCGCYDNEPLNEQSYNSASLFLWQMGFIPLNPCESKKMLSNLGKTEIEQMFFKLIDIADIVFMMCDWQNSKMATAELSYAKAIGKRIMYQSYFNPYRERKLDEDGDCD